MPERFNFFMNLPTKRLFADIKDLAWQWEYIIGETNSRCAVTILYGLAHAYLRGLGYRMGNVQGFRAHSHKLAKLCTEIARYVVEEGPVLFSALHSYGFSSLEKALEVIKAEVGLHQDILTAADEILRKK